MTFALSRIHLATLSRNHRHVEWNRILNICEWVFVYMEFGTASICRDKNVSEFLETQKKMCKYFSFFFF